ncbi:nucleoside/nucleotide kinase family protein [Arthrobacter sp. NPDC058127]|uniref:nucleoside/nucleotide kinase family protein n=1 Tax=Arthrobacter sp. NPDC058127 TaxID=3346351 RepID=UPI0036EDC7B8
MTQLQQEQQISVFGSPGADEAVEDLRAKLANGTRFMLGIVGAPGSGKSTLAARLRDFAAPDASVVVPMDGFHLANSIIDGTPLKNRKGAIDTFDGGGYLSLLRRIKEQQEKIVFAPDFRRDIDEPIAASIAVHASMQLVITEGNYLLADSGPWKEVRTLLDEIWFVESPPELRVSRLVERHMAFGMDRTAAEAWTLGPDQANAGMIESTRNRADRIIRWA